jgi:predicted TPR repeat methyltransferase
MTDALTAAREHFMAGLDHLQAGRLEPAEQAFRASLALLPGRPSTLLNLAATLLQRERPADALPLLDQVLVQQPQDADALGHRGLALHQLQRPAEALLTFERLVQLAPERPEAWFHQAQSLQRLGRLDAALQSFDHCLSLQPGHGRAWSQRGHVLRALGRRSDAADSYARALALDDEVELNRYYLAAMGSGPAPGATPRAYVERLFDDYAGDFERHLVDTLGYDAPRRLQQLLVGLGRTSFEAALDLGCGTGLCGPLLRPMVQRLHGVDLSAAMLQAARARAVYDELHQAELVEHLSACGGRYGLVIAADVLIYLGDLEPVLAAVRRVLTPGGLFAFTVEPGAPDQAYVLQDSLRYAHGEQALRRHARAHGLQVLHAEHGALRADQVSAVQGQYWVLAGP